MTWYLSDFWNTWRYFRKTGRFFEIAWAWRCSKRCVIGAGARTVSKEILVNEGIKRLQNMAKEKGHWMEVDKYLREAGYDS